jgi:hypothetical protein
VNTPGDVTKLVSPYRWLGVEHIYLTENSLQAPEHMAEQLRDFVEEGFVTYDLEREPAAQVKIYYRCMRKAHTRYNWLAFFDVDEYLMLRRCVHNCASRTFLAVAAPQPRPSSRFAVAVLSTHGCALGHQYCGPSTGGACYHARTRRLSQALPVKLSTTSAMMGDIAGWREPAAACMHVRAAGDGAARVQAGDSLAYA